MPLKLSPLPGQESEDQPKQAVIDPSQKDVIVEYLEKQTLYLKTIKNCVVFFVVIAVIAAVFAFFASVL